MLCRATSLIRCNPSQISRSSPLTPSSTCPLNGLPSCTGRCTGKCHKASGPAAKPVMTGAVPRVSARKSVAPPPEAVGIYYSTATGKTQEVADLIKDALGDAANDPVDIGDVEDLSAALTDSSLDGLIVGAPTWNTGADAGRSGTAWDDVVGKIQGLKLQGRKVAVFGCGDQHGYGDYFCDAMEELYSTFAAAGADMVGKWPTEGYEHSESKAEIEPGMFCGLALDQDNQDDLTEGRIAQWTAQVMTEMNVKVPA